MCVRLLASICSHMYAYIVLHAQMYKCYALLQCVLCALIFVLCTMHSRSHTSTCTHTQSPAPCVHSISSSSTSTLHPCLDSWPVVVDAAVAGVVTPCHHQNQYYHWWCEDDSLLGIGPTPKTVNGYIPSFLYSSRWLSSSSLPSSFSSPYIVSNRNRNSNKYRTELGARGQRTCDFTSPTYACLLYNFYTYCFTYRCLRVRPLYAHRQYSLAPNCLCVCIVHTSLI